MKKFKEYLDEKGRCWPGHKPVPGKAPFSPGSCKKEELELQEDGMAAAPANSVGGGNIAGSGGAGGEPGVSKKRNPVMSFVKRKQPNM